MYLLKDDDGTGCKEGGALFSATVVCDASLAILDFEKVYPRKKGLLLPRSLQGTSRRGSKHLLV